jgi:Xaa-Pro aminopeptidase
VKGAVKLFGVDEARPIDELWKALPQLLAPHRRLFFRLGDDPAFEGRLFEMFRKIAFERRRRNAPAHPIMQDPSPAIARLRQIKEPAEIRVLEHAAEVTAEAHVAAMRAARAGLSEYQVQEVLEGVFRRAGSRRNGYDSIVASGANACILHYTENDRKLRKGELLLLDAGAEFDLYTADITRTWPVASTFNDMQREVYRIVLRAQKAAIKAVKPGRPWNAPHEASRRWLTRGLMELGLLKGKLPDLVKKEAYRPWFMHGTSHWLGLDVHDVGAYEDPNGKPVRFEPGMVLTVEPGLYFDPKDKKLPKELRGIGVRIEDDILVTKDGHRNLTASCPKEIREIEALTSAPR